MMNESSMEAQKLCPTPERNSTSCRACRVVLSEVKGNSYSICSSCGSANYIPLRSAEDDNRRYFNDVYSDGKRQPIERRYRQFETWNGIHSTLYAGELNAFQSVLDRMARRIIGAGTAVEIGFGAGHELVKYLKAGANIYGLDISEEAVSKFRSAHPEYGARVYCTANIPFRIDVMYCNALFEHLDDPASFLEEASSMLNPGGALLMRLPLITASRYVSEQIEWDINFWKPCHRILYTMKGLTTLLKDHGFTILDSAPLNYYGYKVMSTMLRRGYQDIEAVRNPYLPVKGLDSDGRYLMILMESLFRTLVCSDVAVVVGKT